MPWSTASSTKCTVQPASFAPKASACACASKPGKLGSSDGWMFTIAVRKGGNERRRNDTHVAGQADEIHATALQLCNEFQVAVDRGPAGDGNISRGQPKRAQRLRDRKRPIYSRARQQSPHPGCARRRSPRESPESWSRARRAKHPGASCGSRRVSESGHRSRVRAAFALGKAEIDTELFFSRNRCPDQP